MVPRSSVLRIDEDEGELKNGCRKGVHAVQLEKVRH